MNLSSIQLAAFSQVAKTGSFSKAAQQLNITQSALSQRIQNLETELATALIIRDPSGLRLTPAGEELLRYCHVNESLEAEFLDKISYERSSVKGVIRIAGFSSVMRSVIMPALNNLLIKNKNLGIEVFTREMRDLPRMLTNNEADFIITTNDPFRNEVESHLLGTEENVLVQSVDWDPKEPNIFLDHDPDDPTTLNFMKLNPHLGKKFQRRYLDEVYALIDGVKMGWGRAILPKHIITAEHGLKTVKGCTPLKLPVMFQYFHQPYYSKLHTDVITEICRHVPKALKA